MRADVNIAEFNQHRSGRARHLDGMNFRFYEHYKPNKERTLKENRPCHDSADFLEMINFAGEKTVREVESKDRFAYPERWAAYEASKQPPTSGTWLKEWCMVSAAGLADLDFFGFRTVEDVAAISEELLQQHPGLKEWQRKAQNWLDSAKTKQADVTNLKEQLAQLQGRYQKLVEQHEAALRRIESLEGNRFEGVTY